MTARTSLGVVHRASAVWMWSTVRLLTRWASSENLASSFMWASTNCWTSVSRPSGWERTMVSFGCGRVLLGGGLAEGSPYAALVFVGLFVDVVLLGGGEVDGLDEGVADGCLGEYAGVRALLQALPEGQVGVVDAAGADERLDDFPLRHGVAGRRGREGGRGVVGLGGQGLVGQLGGAAQGA
ncbi:hypothetical protein OHN37_45955 [Streptomyces sp. NBC_00485]